MMSTWKSFEHAHGTSNQIRECNEICDKLIENYNKNVAIKTKTQKRKPDTDGDTKIAEKKQKTNEASRSKPLAKNPFKTVENKAKAPAQPQSQPEAAKKEFGDKDNVSIFLSNLSYDLKKEEIIAAFPELHFIDVTFVTDPTGRSKGFGYAELSDPLEVEKALKFDRREINGRPAFIKKVVREKGERPVYKYSENKESNKIFIKGLPFNTTKDELQILFAAFGKVKDTRLVTKK